MNDTQKQNVKALIAYFSGLPDKEVALGWGYDQCAAGILEKLGIITSARSDDQVQEALGLKTRPELVRLVYEPSYYINAKRVVWALEGYLKTEYFQWFRFEPGTEQ